MTFQRSPTSGRRSQKGGFLRLAAASCLSGLLLLNAAHATEGNVPYYQAPIERLSSYGVMRGDPSGDFMPDRDITRAEFVAMINRAYGFTKTGKTPFRDVKENAWYADDIAIGYTAGYFNGTSKNTASPESTLTREQAMVIMARCMRLEQDTGEQTTFTDSRSFSSYSKGYVNAAVARGLVNGMPDGSFHPLDNITRGQMAKMLDNAVGNLVQTAGEQRLNEVAGNLTISTSNVTLKGTTVGGDLYISGGVDLNGVVLDNVKVLGRIVVAGSGASEAGEDSVILRNVEASEMIVDTISDQYVSVRAEGTTMIPTTSVRSDAYVQDRTKADYGLRAITLDGQDGKNSYSLSGNLKEVVNKAPQSTLNVAQGTINSLTMDEECTGSKLVVGSNMAVQKLNLDAGVPITGEGDIGTLNVNSNGSSATMLPDKIVIRPNVTATISGEKMDTAKGNEASDSPRLLAGYPKARDIAPTNFNAVFSTNKTGTLYWAVSAITDGSVPEDELLAPSAYGSKALKSGNFKITESEKERTSKISGLTTGGSYYLSAMMVDVRGTRSPVKVISFTTPDNTVPAFAAGYPTISKIEQVDGSDPLLYDAQAAVMTTKDCLLYYAVMPKGGAAPTPNDFRTSKLSGNKGFGVEEMLRNVPGYFQVSESNLEELKSYDLYLWLTDADGAKSSAVKKVSFTTPDGTPPIFLTKPTVTGIKKNSLTLTAALNENGTLYWVAVEAGTEYPKIQSGKHELTLEYARLQIVSGMNGLKSGKVSMKANKDAKFNITGLQAEASYDIYYVAADTAGNYAFLDLNDATKATYMVRGSTLDTNAPKVVLEFTRYPGTEITHPYADTSIRLVFNEDLQWMSDLPSAKDIAYIPFSTLAAQGDTAKLATALRSTIKLYNITGSNNPEPVVDRSVDPKNPNWVIDFDKATVSYHEGQLTVAFPYDEDLEKSAINLSSGSTYYFELQDLADVSTAQNKLGVTKVDPTFTTVSAQAVLDPLNIDGTNIPVIRDDTAVDSEGKPTEELKTVPVDMAFTMTPLSTNVDDSIGWDMIIWSDSTVKYELFCSEDGGDTWRQVSNEDKNGTNDEFDVATSNSSYLGKTVGNHVKHYQAFPALKSLVQNKVYQYAIHFTKVGEIAEKDGGRESWSRPVHFQISVITGHNSGLKNVVAGDLTKQYFKDCTEDTSAATRVSDISLPQFFPMVAPFTDKTYPKFTAGYPSFQPTDMTVQMALQLNRTGTIYYVIAKHGVIPATDSAGNTLTFENVLDNMKGVGSNEPIEERVKVETPAYSQIIDPELHFNNPGVQFGTIDMTSAAISFTPPEGLDADSQYDIFFVLKGIGQIYSPAYLYGFETEVVTRPVIELNRGSSSSDVTIRTNLTTDLNYMLIRYTVNENLPFILGQPMRNVVADTRLDPEEPVDPNNPDNGTLKSYFTEWLDRNHYKVDDKDTDPKHTEGELTVLQAMIESGDSDLTVGGLKITGSLFDQFADEKTKRSLAESIQAARPDTAEDGAIVGIGEKKGLAANKVLTVPCKETWTAMKPTLQYALLATGKSPQGSGYAFAAVFPVSYKTTSVPSLQVLTDLEVKENGTKVDGTVTLSFIDTLRYLDEEQTPHKLWYVDTGASDATRTGNDYISIEKLATLSSDKVSLVQGTPEKSTKTIQLKFTGATNGTSVIFSSNLANGEWGFKEDTLTVRLEIHKNERTIETQDLDNEGHPQYDANGKPLMVVTTEVTYEPEIVISPDSWYASSEKSEK